jgi:hypothetical protein
MGSVSNRPLEDLMEDVVGERRAHMAKGGKVTKGQGRAFGGYSDEDLFRSLFGTHDPEVLRGLAAGGLENADIEWRRSGRDRISTRVEHPFISHLERTFIQDFPYPNFVQNDLFFPNDTAIKQAMGIVPGAGSGGTGFGTAMFGSQVSSLLQLPEFKRIETEAGGGNIMSGYYAWARAGFDAPATDLPPIVGNAMMERGWNSVQEMMASKEGREWWKEYGKQWSGSFDLTPGSKSLNVLGKYLEEPAQAAKIGKLGSKLGYSGTFNIGEQAKKFQGKAAGGMIEQRFGTPGQDNEPISAEPGEWVVPKDVTEKYRPWLEEITKKGRHMQDGGGTPGTPASAGSLKDVVMNSFRETLPVLLQSAIGGLVYSLFGPVAGVAAYQASSKVVEAVEKRGPGGAGGISQMLGGLTGAEGAEAVAAGGPVGLAIAGGVAAFETVTESFKKMANPAGIIAEKMEPFAEQIGKFNPGKMERLSVELDNLSAAAGKVLEPFADEAIKAAEALNKFVGEIGPLVKPFVDVMAVFVFGPLRLFAEAAALFDTGAKTFAAQMAQNISIEAIGERARLASFSQGAGSGTEEGSAWGRGLVGAFGPAGIAAQWISQFARHHAIGGEVQQRFGTPGQDNEPISAEPGEWVVPRNAARQYRRFLEAITFGGGWHHAGGGWVSGALGALAGATGVLGAGAFGGAGALGAGAIGGLGGVPAAVLAGGSDIKSAGGGNQQEILARIELLLLRIYEGMSGFRELATLAHRVM